VIVVVEGKVLVFLRWRIFSEFLGFVDKGLRFFGPCLNVNDCDLLAFTGLICNDTSNVLSCSRRASSCSNPASLSKIILRMP
jgi:hypothetical protein